MEDIFSESHSILCDRLHSMVKLYGQKCAVKEHNRSYTYSDLSCIIESIHQHLADDVSIADSHIGLLLDRGVFAYAAMWASISHGKAYVPLNTSYPLSRLRSIIDQSDITTILCDASTLKLAQNLNLNPQRILNLSSLDLTVATGSEPDWVQTTPSQNPAYILFTSGSTGKPKGVPISYDNLLAFIENVEAIIDYRQDDFCSQICELSFDVSVHEIYLALLNGCTLCPARNIDLFNPAKYIKDRKISIWVSVPSLARVMLNNGIPISDSLNSIRKSIFNGEPLTVGLAELLQQSAPHIDIWNTYGPTECTVAVSAYNYSDKHRATESGIVSIGQLFDPSGAALLQGDSIHSLDSVDNGTTGQLLLSSAQTFSGYLNKNLASPFIANDHDEKFYCTGDVVMLRDGDLFHLGRTDHQVKIGGHRIELREIEHRFRHFYHSESLAVIAHPASSPIRLVLFVEKHVNTIPHCTEQLGLAPYMMPAMTLTVEKLPTNTHGKLDLAALQLIVDKVCSRAA